jgi:alpha-tubulin suppressor-like RCC1 family protein
VSVSTVIKAVAFKPGSATSHISIALYDIGGGTESMPWLANAPKCNPGPGVFVMPVTVTLWTVGNEGMPVSTIRYTTDGSTPTETNGTPYTGPFTISKSTTLKAIAFYRGSQPSCVVTWRYTITGVPIAPPVFGTPPGAYETAQRLTLSAPPGAAIRYTTDGSIPTGTDGTLYTGPIAVSASTTVRAVACMEGRVTSPVSTGAYEIAPTGRMGAPGFSPVPGTYTTARSVTISAPAGATIRYTVDGSTPSETNGSVYAGPVSIAASTTIRAVAYGMGESPSPVSVGLYRITPVIVSAGTWHGAALRSDGTVWTWGWNQQGQLGDGTTTGADRLTPAPVSGISDMVAVSATIFRTMALRSDGTVWGWGASDSGSIGDGSSRIRPTPVQVPGISDVVSISASCSHTVALRRDGTVWAWGSNLNGQLGDGTTESRTTPVQVSGLSGVVAIATGNLHSVAVKNDGTVWEWGYASNGTYRTGHCVTPVRVAGLSGVVAISGGGNHTAVIKDDGTIWTWGENGSGQLGDGSTADRFSPAQVSGLAGAVAVEAGGYHTLAVRNDGTAWAWGESVYGQLADGVRSGDGTPIYGINRLTPVQVAGVSGVVAVSAGYGTSFAVTGDGLAWAWGLNAYGATGDGTDGFDMGINVRVGGVGRSPGRLTPVRVAM